MSEQLTFYEATEDQVQADVDAAEALDKPNRQSDSQPVDTPAEQAPKRRRRRSAPRTEPVKTVNDQVKPGLMFYSMFDSDGSLKGTYTLDTTTVRDAMAVITSQVEAHPEIAGAKCRIMKIMGEFDLEVETVNRVKLSSPSRTRRRKA